MRRRQKAIEQSTVESRTAPYVEVTRTGWTRYYVRVFSGEPEQWYNLHPSYDSYVIRRLSPPAARAFAERKLAKVVREIGWKNQVLRIEGKR